MGDAFRGDVLLPQIGEGCDHEAARASGGGGLFGCGRAELYCEQAEFDLPGPTIGEKYDFGRDLFRQAKEVGCVSPGRLKLGLFTFGYRLGDLFNGGGDHAQDRANLRVVVKASGESTNGALAVQAMKGEVDRASASYLDEIIRGKHCPPAASINSAKH